MFIHVISNQNYKLMHGNNMNAIYFGGAVAAAIAVSGTIGAVIEPHLPASTNIKLGKSLVTRSQNR